MLFDDHTTGHDGGEVWLYDGFATGWFVLCGVSLVLGSCFLPCLLSYAAGRGSGDLGKDCRPDEPLEGEVFGGQATVTDDESP